MHHRSNTPPGGGRRALRLHLSTLSVLLAVGVLGAIAYQAQAAVRSHRATVDRVLTDYAEMAAWSFDQRLARNGRASDLGSLLERLFHPLHGSRTHARRAELPAAGAVFYPTGYADEDLPSIRLGPIPFALRFPLRESAGEGEMAGTAPPEISLVRLRAEVRRHLRTRPLLQRTEGALAVDLGGRPYLIVYSRQLAMRDTVAYALVLDSANLAPLVRQRFEDRALLPEPLVGNRPNGELIALRLSTRTGGTLFRSAPPGPERYAGSYGLPSAVDGLIVSVALREGTSRHLIIGGPPASRLPLLGALLALAAGLLGVGLLQMRREQALSRMRNDFVASVSHELRTPLALQRVFLDMLKLGRTRTDEQRSWAVENIDRESFRLAHLVENVLQFSRAEQGQMRIAPSWQDLSRIVRDGVHAFAPLAQPAGVHLELRVEPGIQAHLDAAAYRQVLTNLLENAVKYGPDGQTIVVALTLDGGRAVLTVDDQGPGVPPHERASVFEPFRRGDAAREGAVAGSGIGLAVVREIVRQHGGAAAVEEAPGGGARIRVALPAARHSPGASPPPNPAVAAANPHPGAMPTHG